MIIGKRQKEIDLQHTYSQRGKRKVAANRNSFGAQQAYIAFKKQLKADTTNIHKEIKNVTNKN